MTVGGRDATEGAIPSRFGRALGSEANMGSFTNWLFPNLSIALTRDALLVSNRDAKATIRTFLYFEPRPGGPAVLSVGKEPSGSTFGERLCLFDQEKFDPGRAWALEAL